MRGKSEAQPLPQDKPNYGSDSTYQLIDGLKKTQKTNNDGCRFWIHLQILQHVVDMLFYHVTDKKTEAWKGKRT